MNNKTHNRRVLAFLRVLEGECKIFLEGACCARHAWEVVELLQTVREDGLKPLRRIMSDGSKIQYDNYSIEQVINTTAWVRSHLAKTDGMPKQLLVKGSDVYELMEEHRDLEKVNDIIDEKRSEIARNLPPPPPINIDPVVGKSGQVLVNCENPGGVN